MREVEAIQFALEIALAGNMLVQVGGILHHSVECNLKNNRMSLYAFVIMRREHTAVFEASCPYGQPYYGRKFGNIRMVSVEE